MEYQHNNNEEEPEVNIVQVFRKYIFHWKWFVLSIFILTGIAVIYLLYQTPLYQTRASILIKDDQKGGALSELSAFSDLDLLKGTNNTVENAVEVLKSRSLMISVVKELHLNVQYVLVKKFVNAELFTGSPVSIEFLKGDSSIYFANAQISIIVKSVNEFELNIKNKIIEKKHFGETFNAGFGDVRIVCMRPSHIDDYIGREIKVTIIPLVDVADYYRGVIKINPVNEKSSSAITFSLNDPIRAKSEAIINTLINQYNIDAIDDKNQISDNTAKFISERIRFISSELSDIEQEVETFKYDNKLVDVESEASLFLQTSTESEEAIIETTTQKTIADYMYDYIVQNDKIDELIPSNLGLSDESIAEMIKYYDDKVLERNRILKYSSDKNPTAENLNNQLIKLKASIKESLNNYRKVIAIQLKELDKKESGINSKIATVPKYEREYRAIARQQEIKESLYLYLLQKREETNIALAVTVANAKVIDRAFSDNIPVFPKKGMIYIYALLMGIAIPMGVLYLKDLTDNKVNGKEDIDKLQIPFLGDVPFSETEDKLVVSNVNQTSVAEAFRLLRTNIGFMIKNDLHKGHTIFVTSTIASEGKSFVSLNIASVIANTGKKVLLIGMDLRAPKLLAYFSLEEREGITNYITNPDLNINQIITSTPNIENLDILSSGPIPPNPAELLMDERVKQMFEEVKKNYDYIIVDTAPVGLVTDTLIFSKYADLFLFVVRTDFLDKKLLGIAKMLHKENRLPNMALVLNYTGKKGSYGSGYSYGYGYGSGYGYGQEKKKTIWQKIIKRPRK